MASWEQDEDEEETIWQELADEYAVKLWIEERETKDRQNLEEMGLPYNDITTGGLSYKVRNGLVYQEYSQETTGKAENSRSSTPGAKHVWGVIQGTMTSSTRLRPGHGSLRGARRISQSHRQGFSSNRGTLTSSAHPRHGQGCMNGAMPSSVHRHGQDSFREGMTTSPPLRCKRGSGRGTMRSAHRHGQGCMNGAMPSSIHRHGQYSFREGMTTSPPLKCKRGSGRGTMRSAHGHGRGCKNGAMPSSVHRHGQDSFRGGMTTSPPLRCKRGSGKGAMGSLAHRHGQSVIDEAVIAQPVTELSEGYIGEAVSFLRVYLIRKNNRTLNSLFTLIRQIPESKCRPEIKNYLGSSLKTLKSFISDQCEYFREQNGVVSLMPYKTKAEIHDIIRHPRPTGNIYPHQIEVINDVRRCACLMHELLSQEVVAVDCEGECLGVNGKLTLVQLSTVRGQVYLVDILSGSNKDQLFHAGRLKELLEDVHVVKVMHNCRSDSAALYCQFGVTLRNVFDTECAYTVILEQHNINKRQNNPGINLICELFGGHFNQVNEDIKWKMVHDNYYWSYRPMSKQMIEYAAADVFALLPQVYHNMRRELDPRWESMFMHLCQENIDCHLKKEGLV
ncbi:uncharacterized protein LOC102809105 [Saccoglossus kowalevskii]|uniref:Exosome component 10-like n=1 Tax=Saccoglossus kowalevskii TaxID=10224 RepID=A0ABM0LVE5_SACKO|nr:PREDICTED: exosome component 10-like [Saccoglossus kowalevskii]